MQRTLRLRLTSAGLLQALRANLRGWFTRRAGQERRAKPPKVIRDTVYIVDHPHTWIASVPRDELLKATATRGMYGPTSYNTKRIFSALIGGLIGTILGSMIFWWYNSWVWSVVIPAAAVPVGTLPLAALGWLFGGRFKPQPIWVFRRWIEDGVTHLEPVSVQPLLADYVELEEHQANAEASAPMVYRSDHLYLWMKQRDWREENRLPKSFRDTLLDIGIPLMAIFSIIGIGFFIIIALTGR